MMSWHLLKAEKMKDPYLFNVWVATNYASKQVLEEAENAVMQKLMSVI